MTQATPEQPIGYECKHVTYVPAQDGSHNDLLAIKEYAVYADGRREPALRLRLNHPRPFWVVKENYRNHEEKKEWEKIDRLQKFECTEIDLQRRVGQALRRQGADLRSLKRSPYVYGLDVTPPVLVKNHYRTRWPECIADNSVAVLDIETDMNADVPEGQEPPIMAAVTLKDKAYLVVVRSFFDGTPDPERAIREAVDKYIGDIVKERGIVLEIEFAKDAGEMCAMAIAKTHVWGPDILAIWNMNFDIPKINATLESHGYNLAHVWSDPSVPAPFKYFKYKEGKALMTTASGKHKPLSPAERWHTVFTPAKFYVLDAMCVYLKLRIAKGKDPSYSLDAILQKHLGIRKLKFQAADHLKAGSPMWHRLLQSEYKAEYCVYNIFDCIGVELLDEETTDLSRMVSMQTSHSEYHKFPSQPRRTCDDLHFFTLERGMVCATTSDKMEHELDQYVMNLKNWIVTLGSHLVEDNGICLLEELPQVRTLVRAQVADLDVEGTYPNAEIICNISKETTSRELCRIEGVPEDVQRAAGIHLSGGFVNAVEIAVSILGAPDFDTLLEGFEREAA